MYKGLVIIACSRITHQGRDGHGNTVMEGGHDEPHAEPSGVAQSPLGRRSFPGARGCGAEYLGYLEPAASKGAG